MTAKDSKSQVVKPETLAKQLQDSVMSVKTLPKIPTKLMEKVDKGKAPENQV